MAALREFLAGGRVDAAVFALRPHYRALLLAVDGIIRAVDAKFNYGGRRPGQPRGRSPASTQWYSGTC